MNACSLTVPIILAYSNKTLMVGGGRNQVQCNFNSTAGFGQVCAVNIEQSFGPCSESNGFGYNKSAPCIFLKLNKVSLDSYFFCWLVLGRYDFKLLLLDI